MFGNPHRYQAALQRFEARHANAGCLLAVLLLLPLLARSNMAVVLPVFLVYVFLVVPVAAGYIKAATLASLLKRMVVRTVLGEDSLARCWGQHLAALLHYSHSAYLHLDSVHTTVNQVMFNVAAERTLCPEDTLACLYLLLFCSLLAYLHQSLQKRRWCLMLHETSTADFVRLTTSLIAVRLGKAIVLSLVMLMLTLQFNELEPPVAYVALTAVYFLLTQYPGLGGEETAVVAMVRRLDLSVLEGLEEWWVPALQRLVTIFSSGVLAILAFFNSNFIVAMLMSYTNLYVASAQFSEQCWQPLQQHRLDSAIFRLPSTAQLRDRTCAVCLEEMRLLTARATPCRHVFHAACLGKCLQRFGQCPLCKRSL